MTIVAKVWIEEDCITCDACQDICPEVFLVSDDSSKILAAVRTDGVLDRNVGGASMAGSYGSDYGEMILEAADACPVEIIKFELQTDGATETVAEVAPAAEVAAAPAAAVAVATGGSAELQALLGGGDRSLAILFGSQTGNAAGLAEKTAKLAANYGLVPTVYDMDGFDAATLPNHKRTLIITSTWGEGEMPDNAESLWQSVSTQAPSMSGVSFSVCAIGDSSYDEFCKAGTDWDEKYVALGASKVHTTQLCDVDFDTPWAQWVAEALPIIACVDESGTLQEVLLDEMIEYGSGSGDEVVEGDFTPGSIVQEDISITLSLFRYCPEAADSGWDTIACAVPGHATVEDLLMAVQQDVDGSLAFRRGSGNGSPTSGVRVNGRIVLSDLAQISDLVNEGGVLKVEPVPG